MIGIADLLNNNGYSSSYLHNGLLQFENQLGFFANHGFDQIIGRDEILAKFPQSFKTSWGVHDEYLMRYAADWLAAEDQKGLPLFSTMFTISNHHPWTMPPGYEKSPTLSKKTAYQRYVQTFRYSDQALGLFIRLLREKGLMKKSIIFVLGDHGQPMGEHRENFSVQKGLYEENVHIPLAILAEGRITSPKRIQTPGSQIDLLPTIMDLLNLQEVTHHVGYSLLRKADNKRVFFHNPYGLRYLGLRDENYKCIYTLGSKEVELFDLAKDKEERHNLALNNPKVVEVYIDELLKFEHYYGTLYENYRIAPELNVYHNRQQSMPAQT
jgi:phosphoglycerol transferase MdoB-like AlkP superfamily enzyme